MRGYGNMFDAFTELFLIASESNKEAELYQFAVQLSIHLGEECNLRHAWPVDALPLQITDTVDEWDFFRQQSRRTHA